MIIDLIDVIIADTSNKIKSINQSKKSINQLTSVCGVISLKAREWCLFQATYEHFRFFFGCCERGLLAAGGTFPLNVSVPVGQRVRIIFANGIFLPLARCSLSLHTLP
jgi:hypothetical protein